MWHLLIWPRYIFFNVKDFGPLNAVVSLNKKRLINQHKKSVKVDAPEIKNIINEERKKEPDLKYRYQDPNDAKRKMSTILTLHDIPLSSAISVDHRFQNIMHIEFLGEELVVVERPILDVIAKLPKSFYRKKYAS